MDIDVIHALVVKLLLHVGDGGVVSRDSVDASVLQAPLLDQLTADLHDQRHKLQPRENVHLIGKGRLQKMSKSFTDV